MAAFCASPGAPLWLFIPVQNRFGGFGGERGAFLGIGQKSASRPQTKQRGLWTIRAGLGSTIVMRATVRCRAITFTVCTTIICLRSMITNTAGRLRTTTRASLSGTIHTGTIDRCRGCKEGRR